MSQSDAGIDDMQRRVARDMRQLVEDDPILLNALLAFLAQPLGEYMGDFVNGVEVVESWCPALDEMFARVPNDLRAFLKTYVTIGCSIVDGAIEGERLSPSHVTRSPRPTNPWPHCNTHSLLPGHRSALNVSAAQAACLAAAVPHAISCFPVHSGP